MIIDEKEILIRQYLKNKGVKESLAGYIYLLDIILFLLNYPSPKLKESISFICNKYGITYRNVQNSIRYALKEQKINEKRIKNKQFIMECIDCVRSGLIKERMNQSNLKK